MRNESVTPLPFIILTGFLGSGKTTLLNRLLADPSLGDTAVLVNEFGSIGLDHLLVASFTDNIALLESGCVCCGVGDDLRTAVETLFARRESGDLPAFRRLILETSGIADPGPLQQRILADATLSARIRIDSIVTVVEVPFGEGNITRHVECASQIAVADKLVVSKIDLATLDEQRSLIARLRSLNPSATMLTTESEGPRAEDLFLGATSIDHTGFFSFRPAAEKQPLCGTTSHADRFSTFVIRWTEALDWEDFKAWLESLLLARGDSILRMKGLVHVRGDPQPVVVQGVQHSLYPPSHLSAWPAGSKQTEIVFITIDFPLEAAMLSFKQFFASRDSA